jgi:uncharacterized protein
MKVDLLSLSDEARPFDFNIGPDEIDLDTEGIKIAGDVEMIGEVRKNAAKTDVRGSVKVPIEIECTRCLAPIRSELDIVFDIDFVGRELLPESKETHLENSDLDTDLIEDDEIDLTEIAREQILLNLPETTLCREECKGICPTCGEDLNEADCQCGEDDIDPRWAALKNLKERS